MSVVAATAMVAWLGCLQADTTRCAALLCPADAVCSERHGRCVDPDQLRACEGKGEGAACVVLDAEGVCVNGLCVPVGCGDNVQSGTERCDGTDLAGVSDCTDLGYYQSGTVSCGPDCRFDVSGCFEICGDGVINGLEACDGDQLGAFSNCTDFGFYDSAPVTCSVAVCKHDTSACTGYCGDGLRNGVEECDGSELGSVSDCMELGFYEPGLVGCGLNCRYDVASCNRRCGDGTLDPEEQCEGSKLGGASCATFGFYADTPGLLCSSACTLDTSGCSDYCGDRVLTDDDGQELCEGKAPPGQSCSDYGFDGGSVGCLPFCAPDLSDCWRRVWTAVDVGVSSQFRAVWSSGPDDVYIAHDLSLRHFDGAQWSNVNTGSPSTLNDVWGASADDIFVVGDAVTIRYFNGVDWSERTSGVDTALSGVWGTAVDDVYAVGEAGVLLYYDGVDWTPMTSYVDVWLFDVHGVPDAVFAVGRDGTVLRNSGADWEQLDSGTLEDLNAVWVRAADDVFAVGAAGTILHFDGTSWSAMPSPTPDDLEEIWGAGPNELFAVGENRAILRFDGAGWTVMEADIAGPTVSLLGVWGSGPADVYVVGSGSVNHLGGARWQLTKSDAPLTLYGGWASSWDHAFAVGLTDTDPRDIWHFDGYRWSPMQVTLGLFGTWAAFDVWGSDPDNVFAVGELGVVLRYQGSDWQITPTPGIPDLHGIWGSGPNDIFAVGQGGAILYWGGSDWTTMESGTTAQLNGVWGSGPTDVWAVGVGRILHYDGTWSTVATGVNLDDIWGSGPDDIYAVGLGETMLHYDGSTWSPVSLPTSERLYSVWGNGPADVFASGALGRVLHYDGLTWTIAPTPTARTLHGAWGAAGSDLFAAGQDGVTIWRPRACSSSERRCGDGVDDDCDGHYDCADTDCATDTGCMAGGLCSGAIAITCGETVSGSTSDGPRLFDRYACSDWLEMGREVYYQLDAGADTQVTVDLTGLAADLDLYVLGQGTGGGCNPRNPDCLGASSTSGDEQVVFQAENGKSYYLVVDGYASNAGDFTLSVSCP